MSGNKDIHESLNILLGTIPGERFLHPDYGCDLRDLSFEKLDASLETIIEDKIRSAILLYEPRIRVDQIYFESDANEGIVFIHILYIINTTNVRTNMVYPFYIKEGQIYKMYQLVKHSNQYLNFGTTQRDRDKYALKPDYFEIDEFNVSQFIEFVMDYSKNMAYIDAENRVVGDWSSFFRRNSTMCLLRLISLKTKGLKLRFITNQSDTQESSIQKEKGQVNENLVEDIINLFVALEECVTNLKQYPEFQKEIQNIVRQISQTILHGHRVRS